MPDPTPSASSAKFHFHISDFDTYYAHADAHVNKKFPGQTITEPDNPENDQEQLQTRRIRDDSSMRMIRLRRSPFNEGLDKKGFPMIRLRRNYLDDDEDFENIKTKRGGNLKLMRLK